MMNRRAIAAYLMIGIGAVLNAIGDFLLIRYYELEQGCALNKVPCPTFSGYISLGTFSFVDGLLILIGGLVATLVMKRQSQLEKETTPVQTQREQG
jgi:hypothetical protein